MEAQVEPKEELHPVENPSSIIHHPMADLSQTPPPLPPSPLSTLAPPTLQTPPTSNSTPTLQTQQSSPMSTIQCVYCQTQLSYPTNSVYIQCPKCTNTMNPQAPHTNYMNCIGCGTLLSHPPSSLTIQCPKCLVIMELPVRVNILSTPAAQAAAAAHHAALQENRKNRKKRKDPHAPKRASNAYMIFCKERRSKLKEDRPDLPFGKLGAKLGEIWRTLSPEEKRPYEQRAALDRERYKKEMGSYQATTGKNGSDSDTETKTSTNNTSPNTMIKNKKYYLIYKMKLISYNTLLQQTHRLTLLASYLYLFHLQLT